MCIPVYFQISQQFQGLPEEVVDLLLSSWRDSTKSQYRSSLQKWLDYCNEHSVSVTQPQVAHVLGFLTNLHKDNKSYSTVNTARSALSSFATFEDGSNIGKNELVCRLMKGIFNKNPPKPRYDRIWDVRVVLNLLRQWSPVEKLTLKMLTLKLCMLIALLIAPRCQTLAALRLSNLTFAGNSAIFGIEELLKTSRVGKVGDSIAISGYPPDRRLCVLKVLKMYIDRTSEVRSDDQLFISFIKPYNKVGTQTISRWIREVMALAGIDVNMFKAHSVRAASVSSAHRCFIPVGEIVKMAGWSNENTFRKYYKKDLPAEGNYQEAILSLADKE